MTVVCCHSKSMSRQHKQALPYFAQLILQLGLLALPTIPMLPCDYLLTLCLPTPLHFLLLWCSGLNFAVHAINARVSIFTVRKDGTRVTTARPSAVKLSVLQQKTAVQGVNNLIPFNPGECLAITFQARYSGTSRQFVLERGSQSSSRPDQHKLSVYGT